MVLLKRKGVDSIAAVPTIFLDLSATDATALAKTPSFFQYMAT